MGQASIQLRACGTGVYSGPLRNGEVLSEADAEIDACPATRCVAGVATALLMYALLYEPLEPEGECGTKRGQIYLRVVARGCSGTRMDRAAMKIDLSRYTRRR